VDEQDYLPTETWEAQVSLVGLDVGTTGCKAIVLDARGQVLGQAVREYDVLFPAPGKAEQDAEVVWQLAWAALSEALSGAPARADPPLAIALSVQGEAVIPVDGQGRALRPAILGMDTRTGAENVWLTERFGAEALFQRTGMPVHTINTLPKLLWLKRHEPDVWERAEQFLLYEDLLLLKLGGKAVISHCLASRTQMYDLVQGDWAHDILDACGIETLRLAPLAPEGGGIVGTLKSELCRALGLEGPVLLVSGGHDQACAALGSGVVEPGRAMVSTGTAEVVELASDTPALDESLREGNISVYRHVVPGLYLTMTLNHSGGLLLRWFRDTLGRWEVERAQELGQNAYDLIFEGAPAGPTSLFVLPHFAGSGTPWLDTTSRGAILGLTFATSHAEIAKAILEGLCYELRANLDLLCGAGVTIRELHAVGGGARSLLWLQLKSDICQTPLCVPEVTDAACLGAALLAAVGAGVYTDLQAAVAQTVRLSQQIEPAPELVSAYDVRYQLYQRVYPTLKSLHRRM
jgi:xylulokinase